jgi:hypothetical protein
MHYVGDGCLALSTCTALPACCQAFDVLERLDPNPEFYEAKRGAAVGVFQAIIAGKEQVSRLTMQQSNTLPKCKTRNHAWQPFNLQQPAHLCVWLSGISVCFPPTLSRSHHMFLTLVVPALLHCLPFFNSLQLSIHLLF